MLMTLQTFECSHKPVMRMPPDAGATLNRTSLGLNASIIEIAVCPDGSFVALDFNRRIWSAGPDARSWKAHPVNQPRMPLAITCAPDRFGGWSTKTRRSHQVATTALRGKGPTSPSGRRVAEYPKRICIFATAGRRRFSRNAMGLY